jgi:O-methyltransferase involved in polyketide biosynthesis
MAGHSGIDASVAHPARVWDYFLGGKDNFAADREAAQAIMQATPSVVAVARADRLFLASVVHYLAAEAGVGQFLDIGTGLPTANNTHQVAQQAAPAARVVYADNDPVVLLHARTLLTSDPRGATAYIDADLRDPGMILDQAARTLDFSRPVAVMLLGILLYLRDDEDPYGIVATLMDAAAPGSYLAITHGASDMDPGAVEAARRFNERAAVTMTMRSRAEVTRFFDGLELTGPGVVPLDAWHLGQEQAGPGTLPAYCGLGRKN